ncbi:MAG: hypothetical protein JW827_04570 [Spirochaetes bacterium]|nr:hypothetical protein [Spirochaetota bacterium]
MKYIALVILFIFCFHFILYGWDSQAFWRSSLLAGWGQRYSGEEKKGRIYTGIELVLLSSFVISYRLQDRAYANYRKATEGFDDKWDTYKNLLTACQYTISLAIMFHVFNMIDAGFFIEKKDETGKDLQNESRLNVDLYALKGTAFGISFKQRF